jgi:hypothetical protein
MKLHVYSIIRCNNHGDLYKNHKNIDDAGKPIPRCSTRGKIGLRFEEIKKIWCKGKSEVKVVIAFSGQCKHVFQRHYKTLLGAERKHFKRLIEAGELKRDNKQITKHQFNDLRRRPSGSQERKRKRRKVKEEDDVDVKSGMMDILHL